MTLLDSFDRPLRSLRISVTDRCNLRCRYCMPEKSYNWLPAEDLLSFEEITKVVEACMALGLRKVRLSGGEPLLRKGLPRLVGMLSALGLEDLALTTNGFLLEDLAPALKRAGLHRLTVSLDTLREDRFEKLTSRMGPGPTLKGIRAAREAGFEGIRLNSILMRGVNDDETLDLVHFAREEGVEIRFIEYMDVGGARHWVMDQVVPGAEVRAILEEEFGPLIPAVAPDAAPARRWKMTDGFTVGTVSSVTEPFCACCDRGRITADGTWFSCLYARRGMDLRGPLRVGDAIEPLIREAWVSRDARGAEERASLGNEREVLHLPETLDADPHLEMHVRGG